MLAPPGARPLSPRTRVDETFGHGEHTSPGRRGPSASRPVGGKAQMFDPIVALTTFAVIFPAELPDKSLLASLVLGVRYQALPVWLGAAAAFALHVAIAVLAGELLTLLPDTVVTAVVTALFALGALVLLAGGKSEDDERVGDRAEPGAGRARGVVPVALTSFSMVFVGEWGDITQLATANLAARYHDPLSVGIGAVLALWAVAGLAILAGRRLLRRVPMRWVRRFAGAVLAVLAAISLAELLAG